MTADHEDHPKCLWDRPPPSPSSPRPITPTQAEEGPEVFGLAERRILRRR